MLWLKQGVTSHPTMPAHWKDTEPDSSSFTKKALHSRHLSLLPGPPSWSRGLWQRGGTPLSTLSGWQLNDVSYRQDHPTRGPPWAQHPPERAYPDYRKCPPGTGLQTSHAQGVMGHRKTIRSKANQRRGYDSEHNIRYSSYCVNVWDVYFRRFTIGLPLSLFLRQTGSFMLRTIPM